MRRPIAQLIASFAMLIVAVCGYAFWFVMVQQTSSDAVAMRTQIDTQSQNSVRTAMAARTLDSLANDQSKVEAHFLASKDVVPFLETLQSRATSLGTTVSVTAVSAESKPRPHLVLTLSAKGSFDSVMRSLGALEYSPYDIQVTDISLNNVPATATTPSTWTGTVNLSVGMIGSLPKTTP